MRVCVDPLGVLELRAATLYGIIRFQAIVRGRIARTKYRKMGTLIRAALACALVWAAGLNSIVICSAQRGLSQPRCQ